MSQILLQCRIYHVERVTQKTPTGEKLTRDIVRHPGAVALVPVVPSNQGEDQICLINNYRVAVADTLVELPAGTMEEGEEPIVTAGRELEEETGYRAGKIEPLTSYHVSPGILDEHMHIFLATDLTPGPPRREAGEQIENRLTPVSEALQMVDDGRIKDAKTVVGLLTYARRFLRPE